MVSSGRKCDESRKGKAKLRLLRFGERREKKKGEREREMEQCNSKEVQKKKKSLKGTQKKR